MATDTLWQRTQLGFVASQPSQAAPIAFPHRLTGLQVATPQLSSQLQFNIGVPVFPDHMATRFRKPMPIVIEKLEGPKHDMNRTFVSRSVEGFPLSANPSLSTDRLAFAVNLAKRDIKRAKLMPACDDHDEQEAQENHQQMLTKERPSKSRTTRREDNSVQSRETIRNRVHKSLRNQNKGVQREKELYFFPTSSHQTGADNESHQSREIQKLRKELHSYMKQLDDIRREGPVVLRNKDKRMKRRKESNIRLSDNEIDERQVARAEEQAARSSRMLYALQHQVQDLQDELNRKGKNIRHTKKSQTLTRLAAAHRAAVRALQTFISQSALHSKASHGVPQMYQDLAILVRQLSLLTAQLQVNTDEQIDELMFDKSTEQKTHEYQPHQPNTASRLGAFYKDSPPTKERKQLNRNPTSPNPSPERDAVLRAGLQALVRARQEASHDKQLDSVQVHSKPKAPIATRPAELPKSVLLPARLKAKRQRTQQVVQRFKPTEFRHAHFAQDTVASTLRKVRGETQDIHQHPTSPPKTPTKTPAQMGSPRGTPVKRHGTPERLCEQLHTSPRSPRRSLSEEFNSPRSPKYQRQMLQEERQLLEREIARQAWLDRKAQERIQEIEDELHHKRHDRTSDGVRLARQMVDEAEEAIMHKLRPLLERAETIVAENRRFDMKKKQSLQQKLTSITSRTTLEQAHVFADGILSDLLDDTVQELQRLEVDDVAERVACGIQNNSTMENVLQRLQNFEKVENDIRRHWAEVNYTKTNTTPRASIADQGKSGRTEEPQDPVPIMFTQQRTERNGNYLERRLDQLNQQSRLRKDKQRFRHNDSRDSDSTTSLSAGISSPRGSDMACDKNPTRRPLMSLTRPTIALFVPSDLRASIASYQSKYEKYLRDTATHVQGSFDPWKLSERISEDLLDGLIADVVSELGDVCDEYTETLYKQELVGSTSQESL